MAKTKSGHRQMIINSFIDVCGIAAHSDLETGKLTNEGGRCFIASVRQSDRQAKVLHEDEDGVEFFAGLRIDERELFGVRVPNTPLHIFNNPIEIESVYCEIRSKCPQNIKPERLEKCVADLGANLAMAQNSAICFTVTATPLRLAKVSHTRPPGSALIPECRARVDLQVLQHQLARLHAVDALVFRTVCWPAR